MSEEEIVRSRREFIKTSSSATLGLAVASTFSGGVYAATYSKMESEFDIDKAFKT